VEQTALVQILIGDLAHLGLQGGGIGKERSGRRVDGVGLPGS